MSDPAAGQSSTTPAAGTAPAASTSDPSAAAPAAGTGWFTTLPEGLRGEPSLQAFKDKDVAALAESHVSAQKMIGGSIRIPGKDAKPEDVAKFKADAYSKLGRPEKADGYTFQRPAVAEMGLSYSEGEEKSFLDTAHKLGLNSEQVQALINWQADSAVRTAPDQAKAFEACMATLAKGDEEAGVPGWGSTTPRYIAQAKRVVDTMFSKGMIEKLDASGLSNDPDFIRGLARIGRDLQEDGIITGEPESSTGATSASAEITAVMAADKKTHPYWNRSHPDHEAAVQRILELRQFVGAER